MSRFLTLSLSLMLLSMAASAQQHGLLTEILSTHVKDGLVNYPALMNDERLDEYLDQLTEAQPDSLDESARLALWINAYNAYMLKAVLLDYPVESVNDLHWGGQIIGHVLGTTVWEEKFANVGGKVYTLNQIEHEIIRKKFAEPRIHFALNCAAISCPPIRTSAYEGPRLDRQLSEQARAFLNDTTKNRFDIEKKEAYVSKLFNWYGKDFGSTKEAQLHYIRRFLSPELDALIDADPSAWTVYYLPYDWSLNDLTTVPD